MEKLEKAKKKHDHKGTKILKLIIFACVMLAPFFSILTRCLYVLNPNAKDSYYGKTINTYSLTNVDYTNLNYQSLYYIDTTSANVPSNDNFNNYVKNVSYLGGSLNSTQIEILTTHTYIRLNFATSYWQTFYSDDGINYEYGSYLNRGSEECILSFNFNTLPTSNNFDYKLITYNKYSYLDNAFEYSLDQIEQSNYYNWTQNTGIYNGLNAMCTGLGVNNVIAILLTYWALCTAIYIVFDIVIELFTKLTHFINAE